MIRDAAHFATDLHDRCKAVYGHLGGYAARLSRSAIARIAEAREAEEHHRPEWLTREAIAAQLNIGAARLRALAALGVRSA